jgi:hypothetical protein
MTAAEAVASCDGSLTVLARRILYRNLADAGLPMAHHPNSASRISQSLIRIPIDSILFPLAAFVLIIISIQMTFVPSVVENIISIFPV